MISRRGKVHRVKFSRSARSRRQRHVLAKSDRPNPASHARQTSSPYFYFGDFTCGALEARGFPADVASSIEEVKFYFPMIRSLASFRSLAFVGRPGNRQPERKRGQAGAVQASLLEDAEVAEFRRQSQQQRRVRGTATATGQSSVVAVDGRGRVRGCSRDRGGQQLPVS